MNKDIIKITVFNKEYDITKELYNNINSLPYYIRNKLYIIAMRNYWRSYTPLYSKIPSWYYSSIKQEKLLLDARLNNIHFLHLPCNTLEENKKYIPGCQCDYCLHNVHLTTKLLYQSLISISYIHFHQLVPSTDSNWNDMYEVFYPEDYMTGPIIGLPIFNPNYDTEYDTEDDID